jgi:hypothetical protein
MSVNLNLVHHADHELVSKHLSLFTAAEKHFKQSGEVRRIVLDVDHNIMWYMHRELSESRHRLYSRNEFSRRLREGVLGLLAGGVYGFYPLIWDGHNLVKLSRLGRI